MCNDCVKPSTNQLNRLPYKLWVCFSWGKPLDNTSGTWIARSFNSIWRQKKTRSQLDSQSHFKSADYINNFLLNNFFFGLTEKIAEVFGRMLNLLNCCQESALFTQQEANRAEESQNSYTLHSTQQPHVFSLNCFHSRIFLKTYSQLRRLQVQIQHLVFNLRVNPCSMNYVFPLRNIVNILKDLKLV